MRLEKPGRPAREQQRALRASRDRARGCAPALGSRARCASSRISFFGIALGFCWRCIFWRAACHASPLPRGTRHSGARACCLPPILACRAFPLLSLGSRARCFMQGHFLLRCSGLLLEMQLSARGAQQEPQADSSTATARARPLPAAPSVFPHLPTARSRFSRALCFQLGHILRRDSGLLLESNLRPAVRSRSLEQRVARQRRARVLPTALPSAPSVARCRLAYARTTPGAARDGPSSPPPPLLQVISGSAPRAAVAAARGGTMRIGWLCPPRRISLAVPTVRCVPRLGCGRACTKSRQRAGRIEFAGTLRSPGAATQSRTAANVGVPCAGVRSF